MKKNDVIERTFLMIKPDGLERGLVGEIFQRLEHMGLKLVAARMIRISRDKAKGNYPCTDEWFINIGEKTYFSYNNDVEEIKKDLGTADKLEIGKITLEKMVDYFTEAPVIISVWEGNNAVNRVRMLAGSTDPNRADLGTIRGTFGFDTPKLAIKSGRVAFRTIVHVSDSVKEAEREIKYWFSDKFKPLNDYQRIDYIDMV